MRSILSPFIILAVGLSAVVPSYAEEPVHFNDSNLKWMVERELNKLNPTPTDMLGLTTLGATGTSIGDLTGLETATNLTTLSIFDNQISDLLPLSGLTNLTFLDLGWNQISDLSPLSGLTNLTRLVLGHNQISNLSPLSGLTNLTELSLDHNQISNLSPLSGLTNLTELFLDKNQISNLGPLSGLINLTWASLVQNQISDLSPLSGLINLTYLSFRYNQISNLSPLSGLTNLTELFLFDNQISNLGPLSGLINLTYLDLSVNQISNLWPLSGLTNLTYLNLILNPLNAAACDVYIPLIKANNPGIDLRSDCVAQKCTLTVSSRTGGSVGTPGEGAFKYDEGTSVSIVAKADANYRFVNWTGTAVNAGKVANPTSASTTVTVDADYTLVANFARGGPTGIDRPTIHVNVENITSTAADLIITLDDGGEACDISYSIGSDEGIFAQGVLIGESSGTNTIPLEGLSSGTTYSYSVEASNSGGTDTISDIFTTTALRVELTRLEINQAFQEVKGANEQQYEQQYDLIASKPFLARIDIQGKGLGEVQAKVALKVIRVSTANQVGRTEESGNVAITGSTKTTVDLLVSDRIDISDMPAGFYDLVLEVKDAHGSELRTKTLRYEFHDRRTIRLLIQPFKYDGKRTEWKYEYAYLVHRMFPVKGIEVIELPVAKTDSSDFSTLKKSLEKARTKHKASVACGILPDGTLDGFEGCAEDKVIVVDDDSTTGDVIAHELGHCYGLGEEYVGANKLEDAVGPFYFGRMDFSGMFFNWQGNPPPVDKCPDAGCSCVDQYAYWDGDGSLYCEASPDVHTGFYEYPFDYVRGESRTTYLRRECNGRKVGIGGYDWATGEISRDTLCIMGLDTGNQWITGPEYSTLLRCPDLKGAASSYSTSAIRVLNSFPEPQKAFVQGHIDDGGQTGALYSILPLTDVEAAPQTLNSDYFLLFRAKGGDLLGQHEFSPSVRFDGDARMLGVSVVVDLPPDTWTIELYVRSIVIAQLRRSENTPVVEIVVSPSGMLDGPAAVRWSASDADGDSLEYSVEYSYDGGLNWSDIGVAVSSVEFVIDPEDLAGGTDCLIKVVASDGWNQSEDTSDSFFAVPTKAPEVTVLQPKEGDIIARSDSVRGRAEAWDRETGYIEDPNAIVWSSDIDGVVGRGRSTLLNLSVGTHVLSVTATDPEGKTGTETVTVTVTGPGLIAHWKFDDTTGTTASDSAGANPGTVNGAKWFPGRIDGALRFDGMDDYVDCGKVEVLAPEQMAIALWMYVEGRASYQYVLGKAKDLGPELDYMFYTGSDGKLLCQFGGDPSKRVMVQSKAELSLGQWVYVTAVRDGGKASLYLNGQLENSTPYSFVPTPGNQALRIGSVGSADGWAGFFQGMIDDVRIYDVALSAEEVADLYEEVSP